MKNFLSKKNIIVIVGILLLAQFISQIFLAKYDSQTTDEGVHLSAGYTYITRADFRFNPEHPILVKILAALPLLVIKPNLPQDAKYWDRAANFIHDNWQESRSFGEEMLYFFGNNAQKLLFWGRLPIIFLTLILGIVIFLISYKFFNSSTGLVAVILYVTNPTINANGHLITTDIAVTLGYVITIYILWVFFQKPNWKNTIFLGLALGFAALTKYTSVILIPIIIVLFIYQAILYKEKTKIIFAKFVKIILAFIITWMIICSCYLFKLDFAPKIESPNQTFLAPAYINLTKQSYINFYNTFECFLVPRDYFKGMHILVLHAQGGHNSFLLGKTSSRGWWYYFPVLFLAKNPIPTLIIIFLSLHFFVFSRKRNSKSIFLVLAAGTYFAFAMESRADLGIRHLLPIFPLLFIIAGQIVKIKSKFFSYFVWILLILSIVESIIIFPNYISYYNQIVGGTDNGYKIARDSNLEWGEDLKLIKMYMDQKNIQSPFVEYMWDSKSALDYYKINYQNPQLLDKDNPHGYLIINATSLHNPNYLWLAKYQPIDRVSPGVFVYKFD